MSQVCKWPLFYLKIGLDIGRVLAKCSVFDVFVFSFGLPIGCQKVFIHPNLYGKSTDWYKKRAPSRKNGLDIGWKFVSSLV